MQPKISLSETISWPMFPCVTNSSRTDYKLTESIIYTIANRCTVSKKNVREVSLSRCRKSTILKGLKSLFDGVKKPASSDTNIVFISLQTL